MHVHIQTLYFPYWTAGFKRRGLQVILWHHKWFGNQLATPVFHYLPSPLDGLTAYVLVRILACDYNNQ